MQDLDLTRPPTSSAAGRDTDADAPATERGLELLTRLHTLAASRLAEEKSHGWVAALEGALEESLRGLAAVYEGTPQPLPPGALRALNLARQLANAASHAFRQVARAASSAEGATPLLVSAARFAAHAIRASYQAYARVPAGAWKQMHALYLISDALGVAETRLDARGFASVAGIYREIVLVALTDPYRLEPGELAAVESLLRAQAPALRLLREAPAVPSANQFVVPCGEDAPPRPLRRDSEGARDKHTRYVDTSALVQAVAGRAGDALLRKVLTAWDAPPKRVAPRQSADGSVAICVGLQPIAYFVAHDANLDEETQARAVRDSITIPLPAMPQDEEGRLLPVHEWELVNLSAGGLRVRRRAATAYPVTVGEVIGIRAPGKPLWMVGVTRWVMADADGTTEFGVQFFAQAVCPVWARSSAAPADCRLAVLVAEGLVAEGESLLAPPQTYSSAGEFELRGEGYRSRMRRGTLVESNARFELFRLVPS